MIRFALPLGVFILLAGLFVAALRGGDPSKLPSALIGRPAPVTVLPPLAGTEMPGIAAGDMARGAIVNVWASWCGPCVQEHPTLMRLRTLTNVPIIGINYKDTPSTALRFLQLRGNPFTSIGADADGRAAIEWGVYGVPETFVIDGSGKVVMRHAGPLTEDILMRELMPRLRLLASAQ